MAIIHHTIPPAGTPNAIDEPQWAEGHDIDSAGITFNDASVQTTAAVVATGTFTATHVGLTASLTCRCTFAISGNIVSLTIGTMTGSSNSTTWSMHGLPASITPAANTGWTSPAGVFEVISSVVQNVPIQVIPGGTAVFSNGVAAGMPSNFNASGVKAILSAVVLTYPLV